MNDMLKLINAASEIFLKVFLWAIPLFFRFVFRVIGIIFQAGSKLLSANRDRMRNSTNVKPKARASSVSGQVTARLSAREEAYNPMADARQARQRYGALQ